MLPLETLAQPIQPDWNLPVAISDDNTSIRFEVDSTWHLVHGVAANSTGQIALKEPADPTSVVLSLELPVAELDTENSKRDSRMREILLAENYPTITFSGAGLSRGCTPALVARDGVCEDFIKGELTILATTKEIELPLLIRMETGNAYVVTGSIPIRWAEYGVEDPSIFVARVDPVVTIYFSVSLQPDARAAQ